MLLKVTQMKTKCCINKIVFFGSLFFSVLSAATAQHSTLDNISFLPFHESSNKLLLVGFKLSLVNTKIKISGIVRFLVILTQ